MITPYMSTEQFKGFVEDNNMTIITQRPIQFKQLNKWNGMDIISIFKKPII